MPDKISLSVVMSDSDHQLFRRSLFTEDEYENFAILFCGVANGHGWRRLLVREIWPAPITAYRERLPYHLEITPKFFNAVVNHSLEHHLSPVIAHSHPKSEMPSYSLSDDFGESRLLPVLQQLLPGLWPASLLVTPLHMIGRSYVNGQFDRMEKIDVKGRESSFFQDSFGKSQNSVIMGDVFDRQIRAIGTNGQAILANLKVGVVGLGGTGSAVAEQLVRLGVRDFVLVDPDILESSNISRVWGSRESHAKTSSKKVDVIGRNLRSIHHDVTLKTIPDSIVRQSVLSELRDRDIIFGCTDNHLSRAVLNRFAHQYIVPVVDMGTRIDARTGNVTAAGGRVTLIGAGLTCLRCSNHIDPDRIREESLSDKERVSLGREGYVQGSETPAPSVISLNTTVAGLAVTVGVSLFVNLTGQSPPLDQIYDATRGIVFTVGDRHENSCDICSPSTGLKGFGDIHIVSSYD